MAADILSCHEKLVNAAADRKLTFHPLIALILHEAGATYVEIGRECGCDWRTVRKYLAEDGPSVPPLPPPRVGTQPRLIDPFVELVEAWLRADVEPVETVPTRGSVVDVVVLLGISRRLRRRRSPHGLG